MNYNITPERDITPYPIDMTNEINLHPNSKTIYNALEACKQGNLPFREKICDCIEGRYYHYYIKWTPEYPIVLRDSDLELCPILNKPGMFTGCKHTAHYHKAEKFIQNANDTYYKLMKEDEEKAKQYLKSLPEFKFCDGVKHWCTSGLTLRAVCCGFCDAYKSAIEFKNSTGFGAKEEK